MEESKNSRRLSLAWLFSPTGPVNPKEYLLVGLALMVLKYAVEFTVVYWVQGKIWHPLLFASPSMTAKSQFMTGHSWLLWVFVVWSLPFMFIGAVFSVRRSYDAGMSGWVGVLFFVPIVNYFLMLMLSLVPTKESRRSGPQAVAEAHFLTSALFGLTGGILISAGLVLVSVMGLREYGATMFLGAPFLAAWVGAYLLNRQKVQSVRVTLSHAAAVLLLSSGAILLFAMEGILCLTMAFPLAFVASIPGALLGRSMAQANTAQLSHVGLVLLSFPFLVAAEGQVQKTTLREVKSSVIVNAPPSQVWKNVVSFSELPPPSRLVFKLGIAYPIRARIQGKGKGAVRYCEFSTGPFVEPITRWEEPHRLSFDVTKNPPSMKEWSPYRHIHPPHLDGSFLSRRGEFRLKALPGGKTLLEGSTWYELKIYPLSYWNLWADALVSHIHRRVLEHIKRQTETKPSR